MRTENNTLDAEVIEHFMRKARVERSLAVAAMTRQAVDSVKNIFSGTFFFVDTSDEKAIVCFLYHDRNPF